jgi:hypothetical protein
MTHREFKYHNKKKIIRQQKTARFIISPTGLENIGGVQCDECKMFFDSSVMHKCYLPSDNINEDDEIVFLCPECNDGTCYCKGCGQFCAGIDSFEFGKYAGYCDNCRDEIESNEIGDDEGEDDNWWGYGLE